MTTHVLEHERILVRGSKRTEATRWIVPLGRLCYAALFIIASFSNFSQETIAYAGGKGVPLPGLLVPLAGMLALAGGVSILIGFEARLGAWLLVLFLVPVTVMMHAFWRETDAAARMMQQVQFMKNLGLLGGALLISHFGAGPFSLDSLRLHPPRPGT